MTVYFPRALLRERSHSWNLVATVMNAGQSGQSWSSVVRSDGGGVWSCVMNDVQLSGLCGGSESNKQRQRIATLLWRAVRQLCDGGANNIVVPRHDDLFRPWPAGVSHAPSSPLPHSDTTFFADGTGYDAAVINVVAAASAGLRATSLQLQLRLCGTLVGGESFSILHPDFGWRLYEIATVQYVDASHVTISFNPPLRAAVAIDTPIEFDLPRCTMRLMQGGSMNLSVVPWTFNQASVDFIEAI